MQFNEIARLSSFGRTRQSNISFPYFLTDGIDKFFLYNKRRRYCCRRWKSCLKVCGIITLAIFILWFSWLGRIQNAATSSLPKKISYQSRNIRVPQYLSLDVGSDSQAKCKQIFGDIIPFTVEHDITDKDLVQSLFGNIFNRAYFTHSDSKETIPIMQGKLCSNTSNEWIVFSIVEKETLEKSTDQNIYDMEALPEGSQNTHQCVSFDFEECSLSDLQNDYPRFFQFDHEQHITRISTDKNGKLIETVYIIYHYMRRKAIDYIEYKDKLIRTNSASFNITIVRDSITSRGIHIKVKMTERNPLATNMDCVAILHGKTFNRIHPFQMINPVIQFDQLAASTKYNICVSCAEINKICEQFKTSKRLTMNFPSNRNAIPEILMHVALIILLFLVFFLIVVVLSKSTTFSFYYPRFSRRFVLPTNEQNQDNHSITSNPTINTNENPGEDTISVGDTSLAAETMSLLTRSDISVQDLRGSIQSISSAYCRDRTTDDSRIQNVQY